MEKTLPFITVVIPAYNEEKYLPICLSALAKQSYPKKNYHVVVVDNNSTDNTAEIAKKFGAKIIKEKQQGHVYSLNTGLKNAQGDIIAVTDADTTCAPNWLRTLARAFEDQRVVGITGSIKMDTESEALSTFLLRLYQVFLYIHFACKKPHFAGPNMALRKSAFKKLKSVDTRYKIGGDVAIGMQLKHLGRVKFERKLLTTTSSRRFKTSFAGFNQDLYKYIVTYFYAVWLARPPKENLLPLR